MKEAFDQNHEELREKKIFTNTKARRKKKDEMGQMTPKQLTNGIIS